MKDDNDGLNDDFDDDNDKLDDDAAKDLNVWRQLLIEMLSCSFLVRRLPLQTRPASALFPLNKP